MVSAGRYHISVYLDTWAGGTGKIEMGNGYNFDDRIVGYPSLFKAVKTLKEVIRSNPEASAVGYSVDYIEDIDVCQYTRTPVWAIRTGGRGELDDRGFFCQVAEDGTIEEENLD